MLKPETLKKGDKIAIVSLSSGLLGEEDCKHELDIALKRLREFGLEPVIMDNALKGMKYLEEHPEARAADLKRAFMDDSIKAIITDIGGFDTYRTFPYLMEDQEFIEAVRNHPKIFTGFSDTTNNHLMLNKLGLSTFYGPCLLIDLAELDKEMLPYTKYYFEKFMGNGEDYEIVSSPVWYSDRESYDASQIGVSRISHKEEHGFEILNGSGTVTGRLYGGCINSFYEIFVGEMFPDVPKIYEKYHILPTDDEWQEKILFLETAEVECPPDTLKAMLLEFKKRNIFNLVKGVIVGKPLDEKYYDEYKEVFKEVFKDIDTPVLYNVNFGHTVPRCVLPYNSLATIDYDNKKIFIKSELLSKNDDIENSNTSKNKCRRK